MYLALIVILVSGTALFAISVIRYDRWPLSEVIPVEWFSIILVAIMSYDLPTVDQPVRGAARFCIVATSLRRAMGFLFAAALLVFLQYVFFKVMATKNSETLKESMALCFVPTVDAVLTAFLVLLVYSLHYVTGLR